ncbi:MAG: YncE family protein [Bacteroidota bacterium]
MNPIKIFVFTLSLMFITVSCVKEKIIIEKEVLIEPQLVLSADILSFNNEETKKLFLSTKPATESEYQVVSSPDWVEVNPESGVIESNIKELSITSNFSEMEAAIYSDELIIMSTSGNDTVKLIGILGEQLLYSIPDSIKFSLSNESESFILKNQGNVTINYFLTSSSNYIDFQSQSGEVLIGEQKEILIHLNRELLETGSFLSEIYLNINEVTDTIPIKVDNFALYSIPDLIKFSTFSDSEKLIIKNEGSVSLSYNLSASDSYIDLPSNSGEVLAGEQKEILVNVNKESLETGSFYSEIYINFNKVADTVAVMVENFQEKKLYLTTDVIDAEFSKQTDKLFYISSNPLSLSILNTQDKTIEQISLTYIPTCISVSTDGTKAVVGHDGRISYVDVANKSIIKTIDVPCYVFDIAYGNNDWAYAIPKDGSHVRVQCINLIDNTIVKHLMNGNRTVSDRSKIKLHPSGNSIYLADNGVSPSDLDKLDISSDTAKYLYDSPYHGDYAISGDLWFSEDGKRIFTRGKSVFKTSVIREQDMLYNGKITLESNSSHSYAKIVWLDHLETKKNLYLLSSGDNYWDGANKAYVYVYNSDNLTFKNKIELEKYLVSDNTGGGNFYQAEPYFVFSKSDGEEIYVITKAVGSGLLNEWAIQTINFEKNLP